MAVTDLFVATRTALLNAADALGDQRDALVVVGAHAVYLRAGDVDVPIPMTTKDSDIVVDPQLLLDAPLIEEAMRNANFDHDFDGAQPGQWRDPNGVLVELLVPDALGGPKRTRGARIEPHSKIATRRVRGLEAAAVDNSKILGRGLAPGDDRRTDLRVASDAALIVAKLHKLHDRIGERRDVEDKDAHDVYRVLRAAPTADAAMRP